MTDASTATPAGVVALPAATGDADADTSQHTFPAQSPLIPQLYRVRHRWADTVDTCTLELEPQDPAHRFRFAPGQFNMLYAFGVGDVPISISGDPAQSDVLVHTLRAVGPVTNALSKLQPGDMVGVRGPFGTHWPSDALTGKDVVFVTGGIGLAPLRPSLYAIMANRASYRNVSLLYGARTPQDLLYTEELAAWRERGQIDVHVTVDTATTAWEGRVGVVTKLIADARFDPLHTVALICGPEIMMRFTIMALEDRGLADEQIYVSMERNMKCAAGLCGHCQFGPYFICNDGPVFRYSRVAGLMKIREV